MGALDQPEQLQQRAVIHHGLGGCVQGGAGRGGEVHQHGARGGGAQVQQSTDEGPGGREQH